MQTASALAHTPQTQPSGWKHCPLHLTRRAGDLLCTGLIADVLPGTCLLRTNKMGYPELQEAHSYLEEAREGGSQSSSLRKPGMESAKEDIVTSRGTPQGPKGKEARMWNLGGKGENL